MEWYRQRFDACPHFMFFLGDAHISSIQHTIYPFGQRIAYAGFIKNRADWYHGLTELRHTADNVIEAAKKNTEISKTMISDFFPWQLQFYKICLQIDKTDLQSLSNDGLLDLYYLLAFTYTNKLNSSPLIDGFALSTDGYISSEIRDFLERKGLENKFVEYFQILTAPIFLSFLQEEELALLKVAAQVKFDSSIAEFLLKEHQRQYFWIQNNYVKDFVLGISYFKERIQKFLEINFIEEINRIESLAKENKNRKQHLMETLSFPKELTSLLKITDDFNMWQDERKKGSFWATHYFSILLSEFARRTDYTLDELKYYFPPEMIDVFEKKINKTELAKRFDGCMILWTLDTYDVTTDSRLIETLEKIGLGEFVQVSELKGFSAQLGKVSGTARILESVYDISKVREGDILVAVMTRPDYLPAIRRAAAFVTDEGGITCHAAIVARELKKPCVIGTKHATKVFKDGDRVEVDATNGVVRKLS